jgi:putative two-component system response regulator
VLLKAGQLNDREFEIMKTHTTIGAKTLDASRAQFSGVRFLDMAWDIVYTHHERFDLSGYPRGIKGRKIPLSGRIVALADVYDALTSKRVYKEAFPHEVATGIILQGTDSHFDHVISDPFVQNEQQFIATHNNWMEPEFAAA